MFESLVIILLERTEKMAISQNRLILAKRYERCQFLLNFYSYAVWLKSTQMPLYAIIESMMRAKSFYHIAERS